MKRSRLPSSSEDSDNGSHSTLWSQHSKSQQRRNSWSRHEDKPSEVFRTDLITAMKVHDSCQLNPVEYYILADPWRQEWEKGVQVPVSPKSIPVPVLRTVAEKDKAIMFTRSRKLIRSSSSEPPELGNVDICTLADSICRYDLNETDVAWLEVINEEFREMGLPEVDELTMERVMEELERRCYDNMNHAIESEEGLGIEYDEDVVCDVCQSPDGEDGNEMVFCDKCNICVHQACYGILKVPEGSWLCRTCALGVQPKCLLCPKKGGAMKPTPSGTKWVHVSCALWIPEVSIGSPEKMEPITKVSHIPNSRWALVCHLCKEKSGACIQCSAKNCRTAFHVTCAFQCCLEMKTLLEDNDEVKFKSFCLKHSDKPETEGGSEEEEEEEEEEAEEEKVAVLTPNQQSMSQRKQKLQQLEEEFFKFANAGEVARSLRLPEEQVDFIYQYWKLKRKTSFNKPLITPKRDEADNLAKQEQDVLFRRLQLFTHLRQDLERVRNLTYMVTRREKMKRSVCRIQEQVFHHHIKLLEEEQLTGVPSSGHLEDAFLFKWLTPSLEDPKKRAFKSFYFGQLPGHFAGKPWPVKESHKGEKGKASRDVRIRTLQKQQSNAANDYPRKPDTSSDSSSRKEQEPQGRLPKAGVKPTHHEDQTNVLLTLEHKKGERGLHSEENKHGLRQRASSKHSQKPPRPIEETALRQSDLKRVPSRHLSGDAVPKCNGSLKKANCNQTTAPVPTSPPSPMKNWGGFRIPKKGERLQHCEGQPEVCQRKSPSEDLSLGRDSSKGRAKARVKKETESDGYAPDAELSDSETEAKDKKCRQPQRLSASASLNRRYRTDIIRRSIMAS
ncbi:protein Jade-1-like isoform X2 [Acipenser oxyrinchus oxyrinchus]|uniref:Protein Jade-1 n=1 Tax=Acipenser oxyrinchus oxyrinchus TaxID=40147 RepID=A0AAD8GJ91_ACIOX|nr:protein Jade-1-like isoform X2 [Acipenser oxyrinchus oxyrinchus]